MEQSSDHLLCALCCYALLSDATYWQKADRTVIDLGSIRRTERLAAILEHVQNDGYVIVNDQTGFTFRGQSMVAGTLTCLAHLPDALHRAQTRRGIL